MKTRLLSIIVLFLGLQASAQTAPSSCIAPALLSSTYANDIKKLATDRMYAMRSADTLLVEIPSIFCDSVRGDLAAIYNTGIPLDADSVFNNFCIHEYRLPYSFSVGGDASFPTVAFPFLHSHGFTLTSTTAVGGTFIYNYTTDHLLNMKALGDSLKTIVPGSNITVNIVGDGSEIQYSYNAARTYTFVLGWSDCPSGCNNDKVWVYTVDAACSVTLVGKSTSAFVPVAPPMPNCNLHPVAIENTEKLPTLSVSPNPADDLLYLTTNGTQAAMPYTLTDIYGRIVAQGKAEQTTTTVDIHMLAPGMYILQAGGNAMRVVKK